MRRTFVLLLFLILSACTFRFEWIVDRPAVTPVTETTTVSPTATIPASASPTNTQAPTAIPTNTPTIIPTLAPTLNPTPTQENLNRIRITTNTNIRVSENGTICRTAIANSQFNVLSRSGDWLQIADNNCNPAWLFNGSWIVFVSGSFDNVPESRARAQSRIGYNTLEVFDREYHFAHLERICPAFMLYMDNLNLAVEAYERLNPVCGTEVIHRDWHPSDGSEYQVRTAQEFVNRWVSQGHTQIIRYTTNEPSCSSNNCILWRNHEVEIARLARQAGFTVVLANTGVGKYSPEQVVSGLFNPIVQAALDYDHYLGFHEYTGVDLSFGFGQIPLEALNDPVFMSPENWRDSVDFAFASPFLAQSAIDEIPFGLEQMQEFYAAQEFIAQAIDTECGLLPSYWHLGRSFWILLWYQCSTGNDELPVIVHTEWGWDRLDDIAHVVNPLRDTYGHPDFNVQLRGWRSLEFIWEWYYPEWTMAETAINQMEFAVNLYPDNHYFLLFTWSDSAGRDWTRDGFSWGNYGDSVTIEFHRLLEQNPITNIQN